jgi:8-oxo-dGTP pyrophosphatase MutT (NUDIX family)
MVVPISVKGVCFIKARVLLLQNHRGEWELPGGRLDSCSESPEAVLCREFREETGIAVTVGTILDSWLFQVLPQRHVFIVTYLVEPVSLASIHISAEHTAHLLADPLRLPVDLPRGYSRSIERALTLRPNDERATLRTRY